ncbi:Clp protease N-terminal domain-containing protein [Duganella sp. S19_KUP01_CR8]|uniref:Clp protease N-terminal domain-containing protein n=1 Tax=Duganella sp. S19_KUP01_CR8 TaxID=3025502 RepID=UPI002FCDB44A
MFTKLKQRWQDMRTIADLSKDAERRALQAGQQHPGAEHYALAALDLVEGSARRVFQRVGADPEAYRAALANRHAEALSALGLQADAGLPAPETVAAGRLFDAQPSGQSLMQTLPEVRRRLPAPLCGAHILLVVAGMRHSAAGRAFGAINVEAQALSRAAEDELRAMMA